MLFDEVVKHTSSTSSKTYKSHLKEGCGAFNTENDTLFFEAVDTPLYPSWARWVEISEFPLLYFRVVPGQDVLNSKILSRVRWLHCQARLVVARWSPFGVPPAAQTSSLVAVGFHPVLLQL